MSGDYLDQELKTFYEEGAAVYAHPVAVACGRIYRARNVQELLDACLRAGEILTRYLAGVALCSFAAREDDGQKNLTPLNGNLAWGHFLQVIQEVTRAGIEHPAKPHLDAGFLPRKGMKAGTAPTEAALVQLLELRNRLGHDLRSITIEKATVLLRQETPERKLREALRGVKALIEAPLFLVEEQTLEDDRIIATMLLLMGESSDPPPERCALKRGLKKKRHPYVALMDRAIWLWPFLLWELVEIRQNYRLFFLDLLKPQQAVYKSLDGDRHEGDAAHSEAIQALLEGQRRPAEQLLLENGATLEKQWRIEQKNASRPSGR